MSVPGKPGPARTALVTGASSAIGAAVAAGLAAPGCAVALQYRANRAGALRAAAAVRAAGARAAVLRADFDKPGAAERLATQAQRRLGPVDILVHTVGPFLQKRWDRLEEGDWESMFRTNLLSAYACLRAVLPGMRRRGWGRVVFFGYGRVEQAAAFPGILPYAAAKAGLLLLTRTAAAAEAGRGVTVNMVSPGLVRGGIAPRGADKSVHPPGTPRDAAEAVRFLASPAAARITGADLIVAGTWKM